MVESFRDGNYAWRAVVYANINIFVALIGAAVGSFFGVPWGTIAGAAVGVVLGTIFSVGLDALVNRMNDIPWNTCMYVSGWGTIGPDMGHDTHCYPAWA